MQDDSTKRCSKCCAFKPVTEFSKLSASKDGLCPRCRECEKQRHRQWYSNPENREKLLAYARELPPEKRSKRTERQRKYYKENREALLEQKRLYYEANTEAMRQKSLNYRANNKEAVREKLRRYRKEHPEIFNHNQRVRRDRLKGAEGSYSLEDVRAKYAEQKGRCYWCIVPLLNTFDIDHIIPISRGGGNGPGNICCSCRDCNRRKHAKMPWEFSDRLF